MVEQVFRVAVEARDPITLAGITSRVEQIPGVSIVAIAGAGRVDVVVVGVDSISAKVSTFLRAVAAGTDAPLVLVADGMNEDELLLAVECRVVAILSRHATVDGRLAHAIRAAAGGGGVLPPDLLGNLLDHLRRLRQELRESRGMGTGGLTAREADVLRLVAEGRDTGEIADELCYSERTVKNVIYGVTSRYNLRNRSHAVAYALRAGLI